MTNETIYTLVRADGASWLARAEDGHWALLLPDPGLAGLDLPIDAGHAVLVPLEGDADIDGEHWLAYRWGEGQNLAECLRAGPLSSTRAIELILRLLDGVTHARLLGFSLLPLRAEQVLLAEDDEVLLAGLLPPGSEVEAPLQSMAELLFHALSGQLACRDSHGHYPLLSSLLDEVDPRLNAIVAGALGEAGFAGFEHLLDLRNALTNYLDEQGDHEPVGEDQSNSPVGRLIRRMGNTDDFPALSRAIGAINRIADADSEKLQALSTVILRDFSLTNKVIRLANSAVYSQFGGGASTISRAVMVLGFNTVKSLALTLVLIEHLTNREQASALKDEVARAFLASLITRKLAEKCAYRDLEEARVAGMFHLLGKMLARFYFPHEMEQIERQVSEGEREDYAAQRQIGASFAELGMGVARSWNLPDKLVGSLSQEDGKPRTPRHDGDWLRLIANAACGLMQATLADDEAARYRGFLRVRDQFGDALRLSERDLRIAVDEASRETLREAAVFGLEAQAEGALARLRQQAGLPTLGGAPLSPAPAVAATPAASTSPATAEAGGDSIEASASLASDMPEVTEALANCIQEVAETLVGEFRLNDLLRMILETLYRGLGAQRALIATRSVQRNAIVGRFGFGDDIEQFLPRFSLPLADGADVFRVTLARNADILIEDTESAAIAARIPDWFRQIGAGRTFLLMPVVIDRKIVGLLYADKAQAGTLQLGPKALALCKTLRNQAILAIRQKTPG